MRIGEIELRVIALDDLIEIKQYIRRPKDQQSLYQLLAIKKLQQDEDRGSGGSPNGSSYGPAQKLVQNP